MSKSSRPVTAFDELKDLKHKPNTPITSHLSFCALIRQRQNLLTCFFLGGGISLTSLRHSIELGTRASRNNILSRRKFSGHGRRSCLGKRNPKARRSCNWQETTSWWQNGRGISTNQSKRSGRKTRLSYWKSRSGFRRVRVTGRTKKADHQKYQGPDSHGSQKDFTNLK